MSVVFELPWPPSELSPNAREHWRAKATAVARYRKACCIATLAQKVRLPDGERFLVEFQFGPPDRRKYDADGLASRMKAGLDGVAEALSLSDPRFKGASSDPRYERGDDSRFHPGVPQIGAATKGGVVWVRITARAAVAK